MSQLITCPECKKHLQVPDELLGKTVQCPECKQTFTAEESTPTEIVSSTGTTASKRKSTPSSAAAKKKAEWDKDDDDDDDDDDRRSRNKPPSKRRRNDDDEDDDNDDDDDDDDDDDRPRRRRSRRSRYGGGYMPHRGGQILTFGILSMFMFLVFTPLALVFGPIAWSMGNSDLAEIRAGRMDPSGEGQVQTGRILGIISTLICILGIVIGFGFCCCIIATGNQGQRG